MAMSHAAMTAAGLLTWSRAMAATGKTVSAPKMAGMETIAHQTASSGVARKGSSTMASRAMDHTNKGGRGLMPPNG